MFAVQYIRVSQSYNSFRFLLFGIVISKQFILLRRLVIGFRSQCDMFLKENDRLDEFLFRYVVLMFTSRGIPITNFVFVCAHYVYQN